LAQMGSSRVSLKRTHVLLLGVQSARPL